MNEFIQKVIDEIAKTNLGREHEIKLILAAFLQGGHVLLESVPGSGKTALVKSLSEACSLDFRRIQCTPDLMPSDVTGLNIFNPATREFELKRGPIFTNILLVDEINRANPRSQSSLLEVMGEKQVTIDGECLQMKEPFFMIATQNPVESSQGTFPLPAAQLDRFMIKVPFSYLPLDVEKMIILNGQNDGVETNVLLDDSMMMKIQEEIRQVKIADNILNYLLEIVEKTRNHHDIKVGTSTRAMLQLVEMVKGWAYLNGRQFVIPDDVFEMCPYVLSHRLLVNQEAHLHTNSENTLKEILHEVDIPIFEKETYN